MLCCCINRGDVKMKVHLGKNFYCPGEQGMAIMEVTNSSKQKVTPAVELNRSLSFRAGSHELSDTGELSYALFCSSALLVSPNCVLVLTRNE